MNWVRLRHLAEYTVFRLIVCAIDALPTRTSVRLAELLAYFVHRILPRKVSRYHVAAANLRTAFGDRFSEGEIDGIVHRMWIHLFRMVIEIVQLRRKLRLYNVADITTYRNRDEMVRAMCCGRPVMMLSGHYGNWEIANATNGVFGFPMGVVARDLDNPYLHNWFARFRQYTGHRLISKKGGSDEMTQLMERRGIIGMLGDQDAGSKGMFVPFFGKDASTFKSIALLSLQYRAIICVAYSRRLPDDFVNNRWVKYELGCEEIIDPLDHDGPDAVREITERYTRALERAVRLSPEQYFWVHRRWKSQPKERVRRRAQAA